MVFRLSLPCHSALRSAFGELLPHIMAITTIVQQESHIVTDEPDGVIKEIPFAFSRYQHQLGGEAHNKPQSTNKRELSGS